MKAFYYVRLFKYNLLQPKETALPPSLGPGCLYWLFSKYMVNIRKNGEVNNFLKKNFIVFFFPTRKFEPDHFAIKIVFIGRKSKMKKKSSSKQGMVTHAYNASVGRIET